MGSREQAAKARRLLVAGASLRVVLLELGIQQADILRVAGLSRARYQPRVSHVLARRDAPGAEPGARREGVDLARRVYRAAAELLGIRVRDIPEARAFMKADVGVATGGRRRHEE